MEDSNENVSADGDSEDEICSMNVSKFFKSNFTKKVIDYKKFVSNSEFKFEDNDLVDLPLYNGSSILDQLEPFCQAFDTVERKDVFTDVPNLVVDVSSYLCQCISRKTSFQLAINWPPAIPDVRATTHSYLILLAKILQNTEDQYKFYMFIISCLFQKIWATKNCLQNTFLVSLARCQYNKKECWAYMDVEHTFFIYEITKKECIQKFKCKVSNCYSTSDKKGVKIIDQRKNCACVFQPYDESQRIVWDIIFSKKKVMFPCYFTSSPEPAVYPDEFYNAVFETITSNDTIMIYVIMKSYDYSDEIWEALIKVFVNAKKLNLLAEVVFSCTFNTDFELTNDSFTDDSHFIRFAKALGKVYFVRYWETIFSKIAAIVDFHDDLDLTDLNLVEPKQVEKVVFNVLKYITQSAYAVPDEWRYIMNILREYLNVRYNNEALTLLGLSLFFGKGIICSFFSENEDFYSDVKINTPENFPIFSYLFTIPFSFCVYGGPTDRFKDWNRRLENHFFPRWKSFLLNISDWNRTERFFPEAFANQSFAYALYIVMKHYMDPDMNEVALQVLGDFNSPQGVLPSLPGWNLSCMISEFFVHSYDPVVEEKAKKKFITPAKVNLPALPISFLSHSDKPSKPGKPVNLERSGRGMAVKGNSDDENDHTEMFISPVKPRKGLSSNAKNKRFANDDFTMELPDLPAAVQYNPITYTDTEDDTSDTDVSFLPYNVRNKRSKIEIQASGPLPHEKPKPFTRKSSVKSSKKRNKPKTGANVFDDEIFTQTTLPPEPPTLSNMNAFYGSDTTDDSQINNFLNHNESDSTVERPINTIERKRLMKAVPVNVATLTNDPTQPMPKLYRKGKK